MRSSLLRSHTRSTRQSQNPSDAGNPRLLYDRRTLSRSSTKPTTVVRLHDYDLAGFAQVAAGFGSDEYAYVVTPNVDHLIRFCDDASFRALYAEAGFVLNDSRLLSRVVSVARGIQLRVCTGSDLTEQLLSKVVREDDRIVLVGGSAAQASHLAQRYGLRSLRHFEPPMDFINDPQAVESCLRFIEAQSPFRFCFLALGCPQQELLAQMLRERGIARGLTLCIGASINYLTNVERRSPRWMQQAGLEWLFRLLLNPRRLAKRYLIRGPRFFVLLKHIQFELLVPIKRDSDLEAVALTGTR
jgi:exopolysaccharide biosynthesis WecB/TagA/CpsF family protein